MRRATSKELGAPVLTETGAHGVVAGPDPSLLSQPSNAIAEDPGTGGAHPAKVDLFEINEAFASVAIHPMRDLDIGSVVVNVNGGAIAMGHPPEVVVLSLCISPMEKVPAEVAEIKVSKAPLKVIRCDAWRVIMVIPYMFSS